MTRFLTPILTLAVLAGCAETPVSPADLDPQFAKPGTNSNGANQDLDARALWEFHGDLSDGTVARVTGDGLNATATAAAEPSEYQGDVCGVHAKIFWKDPSYSQSGDAVFDPDKDRTRECPKRQVSFDLGDATVTGGPFANVRHVMQLAAGESRTQTMVFDETGIRGCARLLFTAEDGNSEVVVTRDDTANRWTVESLPPHRGGCYEWKKGSYTYVGSYELPFRLTITEL